MEDNHKDVLARSQSFAVIRHVERLTSERKGSVANGEDEDTAAVPIQEAQSYKLDKKSEAAVVRRLMDTLTEHQPSAENGHSAASLKVHFRCSLDDISNDDDIDNSSLNGAAGDCSYRSHSGKIFIRINILVLDFIINSFFRLASDFLLFRLRIPPPSVSAMVHDPTYLL